MAKSKKKLIQSVIKKWKAGYNDAFIKTTLIETNPAITPEEANEIIAEAENIVKSEYAIERQEIWNLHRARYSKEIYRLLAIEELPEDEIGKTISFEQWEASRNKKIKAYMKAIDTMRQLENLMHITQESTINVDVNEQVNINVQSSKESAFNLDILTLDEEVELMELMNKARVNNGEQLQSVKQADLAPISEYVEATMSTESEANVEQIKHEIKLLELMSNELSFDPYKKLRENLVRIAAQTLKDKGAKLDEREKKLLENK